MTLRPTETELIGRWVERDGKIIADETTTRIRHLVATHLREIGRDPSGWDALFSDPADGRLWELIYQQSEMQGGGPPLLRWIPRSAAIEKYGQIARENSSK